MRSQIAFQARVAGAQHRERIRQWWTAARAARSVARPRATPRTARSPAPASRVRTSPVVIDDVGDDEISTILTADKTAEFEFEIDQ